MVLLNKKESMSLRKYSSCNPKISKGLVSMGNLGLEQEKEPNGTDSFG